MHRPPPASVQIGRNPWHLGAIVAFAAFAAAALAIQWHGLPMLTKTSVLLAWGASVVFALWHWKHLSQGLLMWDGQRWTHSCIDHSTEVRTHVVMDLQFLLLLKLIPVSGNSSMKPAQWACIDSSQAVQRPGAWTALRRALVFAQPTAEGGDPQNHEAKAGAL